MNAVLKHPADLAPYGAAELQAVARTQLARALAAGSGSWLLGFALTAVLFAQLPGEPDVPLVPYDTIHEISPWRPHAMAPAPSPGAVPKVPIQRSNRSK